MSPFDGQFEESFMKRLLIVGVALMLAGCASKMEEYSGKVLCNAGRDCEVKMGKAVEFIRKYSNSPITISTGHHIQTSSAKAYSSFVGWDVQRTAVDTKHDSILATVYCLNDIGCVEHSQIMADGLLDAIQH